MHCGIRPKQGILLLFYAGINVDCKTYPKTSSVDVKAMDNLGRTALHYLVNSAGSFDNYRLLVQLMSVGVPWDQRRGQIMMDVDVALQFGLSRIATAVQVLKDRNCAHVVSSLFLHLFDGS